MATIVSLLILIALILALCCLVYKEGYSEGKIKGIEDTYKLMRSPKMREALDEVSNLTEEDNGF